MEYAVELNRLIQLEMVGSSAEPPRQHARSGRIGSSVMSRWLVTVSLALVLVGAASCGGDDSSEDEPAQKESSPQQESSQANGSEAPESADTPEAAFELFHRGLAAGDADAVCGTLAPSAVKQTEEASLGGSCDDWVKELTGAYDQASKEKLRAAKPTDVTIEGDKATIEYKAPILDIPLAIEAEKSGSVWKLSKLAEGV